MPSASYDIDQIEAWFGRRVVDKAEDYVDAVSGMRWHGMSLSGKVQGTRASPYDVQAHLIESGRGLHAEGECSCPVGVDCKHVAALLIAGMQTGSADSARSPAARTELVNWLEGFRERMGSTRAGGDPAPRASHALAYVLKRPGHQQGHVVQLHKARLGNDGTVRSLDLPWANVESALVRQPKFATDEDQAILRLLWIADKQAGAGAYLLQGVNGAEVLQRVLATGRAYAKLDPAALVSAPPTVLTAGVARPARIEWQTQADERLRAVLLVEPPATAALMTDPPWYVDVQTGHAGPLNISCASGPLAELMSMPAIDATDAPLVGAVLRDVAPDLPPPPVRGAAAARVVDVAPRPVLTLNTLPAYTWGWNKAGSMDGAVDFGTVSFDYGEFNVDATHTATLHRCADGDFVQLKRRPKVEQAHLQELRKTGLVRSHPGRHSGPKPFPDGLHLTKVATAWPDFMNKALPQLRAKGWRVEMTAEFRHNVIEVDSVDGAIRPSAEGWFDLEMGIVVGDRSVRLEPLLADLFRRDARWLSGQLDDINDAEAIDLKSDRGERLRLRADRLKPVVRVLIDLFDDLGQSSLRVHAWDAGRLQALENLGRWQFHGDASIRQLAVRLQSGQGLREAPVPAGLQAELRPYQRQGLSWMQFLREQGLCGVLADDMGLGKTVQTLAHVLAEKEAGRLDRPALIVVPTTLVHNWREEAQRFAPGLRVLDLQGPQRKDRFEQIGECDLVLTTYALLWRDQAALAEHDYHLLILDEAQYVKNAATKAATTIRELRARHRLCLTGTPLENHLGELWAQFDFLLPGFLGTQKDFTRRWRTPIERGGDVVRRELLARRIRPFMLRRRKDEVARELPPKTMIVRSVELEGAQRDLYETVRAAMQEKVREAISAHGLARSHLIVLDALLKLRQVCCDPRLVKLDKATRIKESAKLELLLEMVPELLEEGRRILLFSQFTGMLSLIAAALDKAGIAYETLTGDTADRATPVKRFMNGEVPLMLISLRAGGVGLNLTAADAVIHYDPWWNPAVENQATDRAHRIGQDKPVFVYKLIAAGSIEEKIVAMQQHKAALADAILSEDGVGAVKFSADELQALFDPMPDANPPPPRRKT